MRKRPGIGAIHKQRVEQERFREKATEIQDNVFEQMTNQMEKFRANLEEFATKHRNEIKKNPVFRRQFQEMCAAIGVDPLASSVQVIEVCLATAPKNGGLITLGELRQRLVKARGKSQHHQEISNDDILRAIKKLKVLGPGFSIINLRGSSDSSETLIRSIPGELNPDHTEVLKVAEATAFTSVEGLRTALKWNDVRSQQILNELVRDGLAWVDIQPSRKTYWFPSFFKPLSKDD